MSNDNALGSPGSDKEWKEHFEAQEVVITGHKLAESFLKDRIAALEAALIEAEHDWEQERRNFRKQQATIKRMEGELK